MRRVLRHEIQIRKPCSLKWTGEYSATMSANSFAKSCYKSAAFVQVDREGVVATERGFQRRLRGGAVLIITNERHPIIALVEEGERDFYLSSLGTIHDGEEPGLASPSSKYGELADL